MLLEIAVGDAYGCGFEFKDKKFIEAENNLSKYHKHNKDDIGNGQYTDDTQLSIAIAEMVISKKPWNQLNVAERFADVFNRDPRQGYASGFYSILKKSKTGIELLSNIIPSSDRNGCAMRVGPIGLLPTIKEIQEAAAIQASVTHCTVTGLRAAQAAALMTHYFAYKIGKKKDLREFISQNVPGDWDEFNEEVTLNARITVRAAITLIMKNDSLIDILKNSVNQGGDTDTVAAIAMAGASFSEEINQNLPEHLVNSLENGKYGKNFLVELDKQLMDVVGLKSIKAADEEII